MSPKGDDEHGTLERGDDEPCGLPVRPSEVGEPSLVVVEERITMARVGSASPEFGNQRPARAHAVALHTSGYRHAKEKVLPGVFDGAASMALRASVNSAI